VNPVDLPVEESTMSSSDQQRLAAKEILAYYDAGNEAQRLLGGTGQLEFTRTQELLQRFLPCPPAIVYDIGGGAGIYACWLAEQGYEVHLVDVVPLHIEQARAASSAQPDHPIASLTVGDARAIDRQDESVDAVLLLGPLYHLTEREDRLLALREARRILRSEGAVFAVGISRFASALDGLLHKFLDDADFMRIVEQDLAEGQHRNPTEHPGYFTTAYFHRPEELAAELEEADLHLEATIAVEGPGWLLQDLEEWWRDSTRRERLLSVIRWLETEASVIGVSSHIMAIGRKLKKN
jgi:ubiquinone/menaquinone biosynthesis C-methylase UbiE